MPALPGTPSLPGHASGRGVAGSGMSLLSALCGPSARCGQDARAPRNIAPRATPWERGRPARKRAAGPPHRQAGDACALGRPHHSQGHPLGARASRPQAGRRPAASPSGRRLCSRETPSLPTTPREGSAGSGLSLRHPRSQEHHSQGHPLGARASRPQAGRRPAASPSGRRLRSREPHHSHDPPSGRGVAGSGMSLLSALCGPSARCGQDARAPRNIAPGKPHHSQGHPLGARASRPQAGRRPAVSPSGRRLCSRETPSLP